MTVDALASAILKDVPSIRKFTELFDTIDALDDVAALALIKFLSVSVSAEGLPIYFSSILSHFSYLSLLPLLIMSFSFEIRQFLTPSSASTSQMLMDAGFLSKASDGFGKYSDTVKSALCLLLQSVLKRKGSFPLSTLNFSAIVLNVAASNREEYSAGLLFFISFS